MYPSRGGAKHCNSFRVASSHMAAERLRMENEGDMRPHVDTLAFDVHALSVAAISKHGGINRGKLEQIAVEAIQRADSLSGGVLELPASVDDTKVVEI